MRVPLHWLQEFVDLDYSPQELAERLTMQGVAVEAVERMRPECRGVVVGEIAKIEPHPSSRGLSVVQVQVPEGTFQVICGATNIAVGDKVPLALPGSVLPGGKKIEVADFDGVQSQGMVCATTEILFGKPHLEGEGVLILDKSAPLGEDVISYLDLEDEVFVLDLTPNYASCLSVLGVAYEAAAITKRPVRNPLKLHPDVARGLSGVSVTIEDAELCPRYAAKLVRSVEVGMSPPWMQWRLHMAGMRPINNIVDVTNYVMLEVGQPLHAFDFDKLGNKIVVRRACQGETIVTLDGEKRELSPEMLLITDSHRPVAIAGVMGGLDTEVTLDTKTVLLEAALFKPASIRRTSGSLGIRSEAAIRFEKGVDPSIQPLAAERAAQWIERLGAGIAVPGVVDEHPNPLRPKTVSLRLDRALEIIGVQIPKPEAISLLQSLDFEIRDHGDTLAVTVPARRVDIDSEIDLVEELARTYGFENIPATSLRDSTVPGGKTPEQTAVDQVREFMMGCGLQEIITPSLIGPGDLKRSGLEAEIAHSIRLANPIVEDQSLLPRSLLPGMLKVMAYNIAHGSNRLKLFEIGKAYFAKSLPLQELPDERLKLSIGATGEQFPVHWDNPRRQVDFYWMKGIVEALMARLGIDAGFVQSHETQYHPYRQALVIAGPHTLGSIGELHPDIQSAWDLPSRVLVAELDLDLLLELRKMNRTCQPIPRYPCVERDIAFVVGESVPFGQIAKAILEAGRPLAVEAKLFDVFKGSWVPEGKRSLAVRITYRAEDRTLTDSEVDSVHQQVRKELIERFGATLRS
ncbi:MAG TPA: phenylalanine--tRNA ligase subunit beta [Firmicutes bacterium]|nr:phenylalanine--tRNA ligase subunit beta [Bacillota bacterium]